MDNKKSQFYLIAAIIIIIIIFGIYTVRNYVKSGEDKTVVYDLQKEFGLESGKIEDFTLYNKYESGGYIDAWIETYVENRGQNLDSFIVIYGDETQIIMQKYTKPSSGNICLGDSCYWNLTTTKVEREEITGEEFHVILGNLTYDFNLEPGKNFIFIIKEGEFVASQ